MTTLHRFIHAWRTATQAAESFTPLHSTERMQALLSRERMRSDRGHSRFALLTFSGERRWTTDELTIFAQVCSARIRATDDAGVLAADQVGVILPETPADGAWKLAEDLVQLLPVPLRTVRCDVFVYPNDDDFGAAAGDDDDRRAAREVVVQGAGSPAREGNRRHGARPMHTFFAQPLPLWKRAFDVAVSGAALIAISPLLLGVAAAIKLTSSGPVIFKQRRDTLGGRSFMIYKFRTMSVDAEQRKAALRQYSEQDGPAFKLANDPRVTSLGRFLRSTSIDELPQLLNVLKGDMTLVGPRAMDSRESSGCEAWQRRRLDVTAGITCIWQVYGRSSVTFAEWMRMDLRYIRTRSAAGDIKLLVQTVPAVVTGRGAC